MRGKIWIMVEKYLASTDALPEWYSAEEIRDFTERRTLLTDLERDRGIPSDQWFITKGARQILQKHPDAHDFLAFHVLIGSGGIDKKDLRGFDYPDGAILEAVSKRLIELGEDKDDKIKA